ncbi:MAG: hypothetical protein H6Q70_4544, partial [Firmicutes bacterium]|nr:hypothetical protein [Bacillota bacterium]
MEKIGLLAGVGKLPVEFARAAKGMGFAVFAVSLVESVEKELAEHVEKIEQISVGQLDAIFEFLKQNNITRVTMLGKVTKELMFDGKVVFDDRMKKILVALPDNNDDTLMLAFVRELAIEGITVFDQTALIRSLIVKEGTLTNREP